MELLSSLRAADSDRERVAERLRHATSEGRLTRSELEERLETLYASRTYGDLDALVDDLPGTPSPRRPNSTRWRWAAPVSAAALLIGVLAMLALARVRAAVAVMPTGHPRQLRLPGGPPDLHQGLIAAASTGAGLVVLLALGVILWTALRSRPSSRGESGTR